LTSDEAASPVAPPPSEHNPKAAASASA
jgi:hypothetical protein